MSLKIIGAVLVVAACGGIGISMAAAHRREERGFSWLIKAINFMEWELQFRLTPLPGLCRSAAGEAGGEVGQIFSDLADELDRQVAPDAAACMGAAIRKTPRLSADMKNNLTSLGHCLGRFDLQGQLKGLESVRLACCQQLSALHTNRQQRLRGYQTLGFCAGAALVILFI